jgi:hypothetical protein
MSLLFPFTQRISINLWLLIYRCLITNLNNLTNWSKDFRIRFKLDSGRFRTWFGQKMYRVNKSWFNRKHILGGVHIEWQAQREKSMSKSALLCLLLCIALIENDKEHLQLFFVYEMRGLDITTKLNTLEWRVVIQTSDRLHYFTCEPPWSNVRSIVIKFVNNSFFIYDRMFYE